MLNHTPRFTLAILLVVSTMTPAGDNAKHLPQCQRWAVEENVVPGEWVLYVEECVASLAISNKNATIGNITADHNRDDTAEHTRPLRKALPSSATIK